MADDRTPKKSPYTLDRGYPGAFEGETVTRRRLMTVGGQSLGGVAAAAFALPALAFAVGPLFERKEWHWQSIGAVADLPKDTYIPKVITETPGIGETGDTTIYVRQRNASIDTTDKPDQYNQIIAISTRCMHLGCPVRFVQAAARFICPCHGGVYDFQGQRTGGPPVRPLDRFYTRVRNGTVEVGPRFSVNSHLKRFSPRDPGEDTDGIGQYLYPARFSTPAKP
jgi:menaquinol-cytochrome c reductase iron-sulfur subunit